MNLPPLSNANPAAVPIIAANTFFFVAVFFNVPIYTEPAEIQQSDIYF